MACGCIMITVFLCNSKGKNELCAYILNWRLVILSRVNIMSYDIRWWLFFCVEICALRLVTSFFPQCTSDVLVWLGPSPSYWASQHGWQFAHCYCPRQDFMAQWLNYWLPQQTALLLGCLSWLLRFLWLRWTTSEAGDSQ